MSTDLIPEAVIDDLAQRLGRIATEDMLRLSPGTRREQAERNSLAIAGFLAAAMTLDAASAFFGFEEVAEFVDWLRTDVARYEEMAE